jgi:hypothetical protein
MKNIFSSLLLLLLYSISAEAQLTDPARTQPRKPKSADKDEWHPKTIVFSFFPDSVKVENLVSYIRFRYEGPKYEMQDAVKLRLRVTNLGTALIPEIQTNRHRGDLKIYIDGQRVMEMSMANMMFGDEHGISQNASDTFDLDLQITGPDAIDYGYVFTWQWEYAGIRSEIVKVDIVNRTAVVVSEHIKVDKILY